MAATLVLRAMVVLIVAVVLAPSRAWAVGEAITDVRILGNSAHRGGHGAIDRRREDRRHAGAGHAREHARAPATPPGSFADVNVWWEQNGEGVRINIAVKDKFPWAPVPTASWSSNNRSIGLVFVDGNLFGRGKQLVVGGRLADVDSGAVLAYRDPALFGGWGYWQLQGNVQKQVVPEYDNNDRRAGRAAARDAPDVVRLRDRVRHRLVPPAQDPDRLGPTEVNVSTSDVPATDTTPQMPPPPATKSATVGVGKASLSFDFRAREFAVMTGTSLGVAFDLASPSFGERPCSTGAPPRTSSAA